MADLGGMLPKRGICPNRMKATEGVEEHEQGGFGFVSKLESTWGMTMATRQW
jgi:hypothetical protein